MMYDVLGNLIALFDSKSDISEKDVLDRLKHYFFVSEFSLRKDMSTETALDIAFSLLNDISYDQMCCNIKSNLNRINSTYHGKHFKDFVDSFDVDILENQLGNKDIEATLLEFRDGAKECIEVLETILKSK